MSHTLHNKLRSSNNSLLSNKNQISEVHSVEGGYFNPFKRVKSVSRGIREDYSPKVYEFILRNYNEEMVSFKVCRRPIPRTIDKALNLMSLGKWDREKKNYGFDTFFHLFIVGKTRSGKQYIIEKNAVINVGEYHYFRQKGDVCDTIPPPKTPIKLGVMMKKAEEHMKGKGYFLYDPFNNNCQVFVFNVLRANGLMDDNLKKFILQNVEGVVSAQKSFFPKVAKAVTNLGGLADKFLEGDTNREEIKEQLKPDITEEAYEGGGMIV